MLKTDIIWPGNRRYKSRTDWEPIGFFSDCLCNATSFDLMLGFFSSSAINVLATGFAAFLYNGGKMRLIINDILTENDKEAIERGVNENENIPYFDLSDIRHIYETLSERDKHFFDCIAWLIRNDRIDIKVISPLGGIGISHTKSGVFYDGTNYVGFDGSCNFSRTALIDNIESLTISCDWDGEIDKARINGIQNDIEQIIQERDNSVSYIPIENIKTQITDVAGNKSLDDLLEAEYNILNNASESETSNSVRNVLDKAKQVIEDILEEINNTRINTETVPRFPYGNPRDYQQQAFENWRNNNQKGLFAMATGTGKTITSLNCLLEIYNRNGYYKALILVPTITLVEQWENECRRFNFTNIIKVCSRYNNWKEQISPLILMEQLGRNNNLSYIIISTYASFARQNIFEELNKFPRNQLLFIADEAHNMGSGRIAENLDRIVYSRRIGLSATPERQYDEINNNRLLEFFGCTNNQYTFEYSMADAIESGALCRYYYYPHIVNLTESEMNDYVEISRKIVRIMNHQDEEGQEPLKMLFLARKRIIHKAANKLEVFRRIVNQRMEENGNLKYTLVYLPEGNKPDDYESDIFDNSDVITDDGETARLIDDYTRIVRDTNPHTTVQKFISDTEDKDVIIRKFAEGQIHVLTSMKCLDEGVDVPRSEFAIFCASTGNPRQFIQRRGRVLRTHPDKQYAIIHDLIVIPNNTVNDESYRLERGLVNNELKRVRDFALLSENLHDTLNELRPILDNYNLTIFNNA